MSISQTLLLFFLVILTTTFSGAFLLNDHANASVGHPDSGNYNIYSKIDALERSFQNLETTVREKTTHSDTLMRQVLLTVTEMDTKMGASDLLNMSLEIEEIKNNVKNITATKNTYVGFTTKLGGTYSSTTTVIQGYQILFNQGNAYNGTVFTCPSPGLYLFHVSVLCSSKINGVWIYKNLQQLTLAYSGYDPQYNGASVSAAMWLDVGDQVYLLPYASSLHLDSNSAFTGIKIV